MAQRTVWAYHKQPISRREAIDAFRNAVGAERLIGLAYAPRRCFFFELPEDAEAIEAAYEVRAFCEDAELRWWNDPTERNEHRAAVLSVRALPRLEGWEVEEVEAEVLPNSYLLWGQATGLSPRQGWSELAVARIGTLAVPLGGVPAGASVQLRTEEYLVRAGYGNTIVWDERLVALEVAR